MNDARRPTNWFVGLDGLRAIAVIAVVTFHFWQPVLPAGFLGVDLFFVISGYLITRLIIDEIDRTGGFRLAAFYRRRARRLLPAVYVLIAVVSWGSLLFWRDQLALVRGSVLSSLTYVTNWWLIFAHQSYFVASGRPPLLEHLWSLAIEEQFYAVWPLLLVVITGAVLRWRGRDRLGRAGGLLLPRTLVRLATAAFGLAILSTLLMALLAVRGDIPYGADSGRIYFGTDTHAMGLFVGAGAGAMASRAAIRQRRPRLRGAFITDVAAVSSLALLWQISRRTSEFTPWLYRGGFLLVSVLCAVLIAAVVRPHSALGWALDRKPLRWIGQRSYAIYLWHWPVALVTRPGIDLAGPAWLIGALRVGLTLTLAAASYRFIEVPFRRRTLRENWALMGAAARGRLVPAALAGGLVITGAIAAIASGGGQRGPSSGQAEAAPIRIAMPVPRTSATGTTTRSEAFEESMPHRVSRPQPAPTPTPTPTRTPTRSTTPAPLPVSAFGDSVMLGAASALSARLPSVSVDAVEGRQAREVFATIAAQYAAAQLGPVVVIHVGDNGIVSPDDLRATLRLLADRRRVVVVTDRVARDWEGPNNVTLKAIAREFRNTVVVDWYAASNGHRDWFFSDGLHLAPAGAAAYADLIVHAIR